jgi:GTP-binding protein
MGFSFRKARFLTSAFELEQLPPDQGAEIAFAGRSNAGKSSAINCLAGQKNLCKTSKTPGRTQLINFFELTPGCRLVDLPGYGFARVPKTLRAHWDRVLSRYLLERRSLRGLVIVVDIRRGINELDQALIDMIGDALPLHILLTKADKLSRSAVRKAASGVERCLPGPRHSLSTLSIVDHQGLDSLQQRCRSWLETEAAC